MKKLLVAFLALASVTAEAGGSPMVNERLADIVEDAVKETGFSINISESTAYSVNINTINGRSVCDKAVLNDVKRFQDAVGKQPDVRNNFGPAYYSTTAPDGKRTVSSPEQMIQTGVIKGCTNIYVRVIAKEGAC